MRKFIKNIIIFTLIFTSFGINLKATEVEEDNYQNQNIELNEGSRIRTSLNLSQLQMTLEVAKKTELSELTEKSKTRITNAINKANRIIDGLETSDQDQVNLLETELYKSVNEAEIDQFKKVDRLYTEATYLLNKTNKYKIETYTKKSMNNLANEAMGAKIFLANSSYTQEQAKRVYDLLNNAYKSLVPINGLETKSDVLKSMDKTIAKAKSLKAYDYSQDSFSLMLEVLAEVEEELNNKETTVPRLAITKASLDKTVESLVLLEDDNKVKLETLILEIKSLDLNLYQKDSQVLLMEALKLSEELFLVDEDPEIEPKEVSQEEYKLTLDKLQTAKDNLRLIEAPKVDEEVINPEKTPEAEEVVVETEKNPADTGIEQNNGLYITVIVGAVILLIGLLYVNYRNKKEK